MEEKALPKLLVSREEAKQKIQERINKGQQLHDRQIDSRDEYSRARNDHGNWSRHNKNLLLQLFDGSLMAEEYARYCIFYPMGIVSSPNREERVEFSRDLIRYRENVNRDINYLMGIQDQLELYDESTETLLSTFGDEIFIVHGRDDGTKETVARFVEKLGLKATILHEQPSGGQTIIEKLEKYADNVGFAIVLLTPDDIGALKDEIKDESKPRARQNVVFELGYFMGKLGRNRVCPLLKEKIENPSDIDGVVYVPMDGGDWKLKLGQEMKNAGFPVDMNKIF